MKVEIRANDAIKKLRSLSAKYPEIAESETEKSLRLIVARLESETVLLTPAGVGGAAGLRGSIHGETRKTAKRISGIWGTPLSYGEAVEYGRGPGTFPPHAPLELWVRRKLGIPSPESIGVAKAIQYKILRKGTDGAYMFDDAWNKNSAWAYAQIAGIPGRIIDTVNKAVL